MATPPTPEEIQEGYLRHLKRQEKQRGYQKRYAENKKKECGDLLKRIEELEQQNTTLMFYYYLFYLYSQQHPDLLNQFITELSRQHLQPPEFHDAIQRMKPYHGNAATIKQRDASPEMVLGTFVTPAIGPFVKLE